MGPRLFEANGSENDLRRAESMLELKGSAAVWLDRERFFFFRQPWSELPRWLRVFRVLAIIGLGVSMTTLLTLAGIEAAAALQPKVPDAVYIYPHSIKGTVHCLSRWQQQAFRAARPLFFISWGFTVLTFCGYGWLEQRFGEARNRSE